MPALVVTSDVVRWIHRQGGVVAFDQGVNELERAVARLREQHRHEIRHDVVDPDQIRRLAERVRESVRVDPPETES